MRVISVEYEKGNEAEEQLAKWLYSACLSGAGRFLRPSCLTQEPKPCSRSLKRESLRTALFTPTLSRRTMHSTSQNFITCASIIPSSSPTGEITSTGSKTFGTKPNDICEDSMASNRTIFIGFSRSANGASMEATIKTYTNSLNTGIPSQSTNP